MGAQGRAGGRDAVQRLAEPATLPWPKIANTLATAALRAVDLGALRA